MSGKPVILITGISGFVGSHVALELVDSGYSVRGTVRSTKRDTLQSAFAKNGINDVTLVPLEDMITGDFTEALQGVHAVIHIATHWGGDERREALLQNVHEGILNIIRQAAAAGVNKIVLTSGFGTLLHPSFKEVSEGITFDANSWGNVTEKDVFEGPTPTHAFLAAKILSEKAAWTFAKEHPKIDLATVHPPFIYGPFANGFPVPNAVASIGTDGMLYALISGEPGRPLSPQFVPFFCDVRDVARAHVAALKLDGNSPSLGQNKRYLVSGGAFTWKEATEYIAKEFPELKTRLPSTENPPALPGTLSTIDVKPASEDLGLREYIPWQVTVRDTIRNLLEAEKSWKVE